MYMPGATVFHRKLTYLQGSEHDHLVVSSANLTLAGHGKNLEVLDVSGGAKAPLNGGARLSKSVNNRGPLWPAVVG